MVGYASSKMSHDTDDYSVQDSHGGAENPEFFNGPHDHQQTVRNSSHYTISNMSVQRVISRASRDVDYFNQRGGRSL